MIITTELSDKIERARVQIKVAHEAAANLLCGRYSIDLDRLLVATNFMEAANSFYTTDNICAVEDSISWAFHYASTCGAPVVA